MEFRLLGPVEVLADGCLIDIGPARQRCVLAALAVDAGRPVLVDTLVDRVWAQDPPQRAREALYVYINRLRKRLDDAEPTGAGRLVRRSNGYLLDVDPDQVDAHRFRRLVAQARQPGCPPRERASRLRTALELNRDTPLADLTGEWIDQVRVSWQQEHLAAATVWAQAELELGNASVVTGPLAELMDRYPLTESLVGAMMRALHAAGRGAEALDCYARSRARLAAELGVDPGSELQELHQAILRGELVAPAVQVSSDRAAQPVVRPAQLPFDVSGFSGRTQQLARLNALLDGVGRQATAVVISAMWGTAGVGKTALAVHWAHRVRDQFPDGQLYVNLRGFEPTGTALSPAEAVRGFLAALGVPPQRIPVDLAGQSALYRSMLDGRRMLVVLDNARGADQVRPLLPGSRDCFVVITSRNRLTSLIAAEGAHPLPMDLLSAEEGRALLTRRLGTERVDAEPVATNEIVAGCARLPLALAVAAARAATEPGVPLAALAGQLRDANASLDVLSTGDDVTDVRAVFSWSYQALSPAAAELFRLLGLHPGPDISAPAAASLAALTPGRVAPLLAELVGAHLVTEQLPGRYSFHDLLRAFAADLATRMDPDQTATISRLLDHYLHTAYRATRLLSPGRKSMQLAEPEAGVTPEELHDQDQAAAWFTAEHAVLLAVVSLAEDAGFDTHTWQLVLTLDDYLDHNGHWADWLAVQERATNATRRLGNTVEQARTRRIGAIVCAHLGRYEQAVTYLNESRELSIADGDPFGHTHSHQTLAWVHEQRGAFDEALHQAQQAYELARAAGNRRAEARALNSAGDYHSRLGNHALGLENCQAALAVMQEVDDVLGMSFTWQSIGYAQHQLGDYRQAVLSLRNAVELHQKIGNRGQQAATLDMLGDAHDAFNDLDAAQAAWRHAVMIYEELGNPDADKVRTKLR